MALKIYRSGAKYSIEELVEKIMAYEPMLTQTRATELAYTIEGRVNENLPATFELSLDDARILCSPEELEELSEKEFDELFDDAFTCVMRELRWL